MLTPNLSPFPTLSTDRLILREITLADSPDLFFLRSHPAIMTYLDRDPDANEAATQKLIQQMDANRKKNNGINWALTLKDNPKQIGILGIWRMDKAHHRGEIGYRLHPDFQGQGFMSEGLSAILDYAFQKIPLHSIEANVHTENEKSIALLKRMGFRKEAYFTENYYYNGVFSDSVIFSLLERWR